ncbi:MAG: pilus assembly protein PilM [Armatimonadetes bacterium]|nr:pilus assembly protein PilM [Armatimonadota bacterium]
MIGIDIGSGAVKVVVLRQHRGRLLVTGIGTAPVPAGKDTGPMADTAGMAHAVRAALDRAGVRRARAMCGLPRHAAAVRWQVLPGRPSPQLAQAAILEATRTLPFPPSEVVTGIEVHAAGDEHRTATVVAGARSAAVAAYRAAIAAAGVSPKGLCVGSLAAVAGANTEAAPAAGDEPWLLVDIGAHSVAMEMIEGGVVRTSRAAMFGGDRLTRALAADLGCAEEAAETRKLADGIEGATADGPAVAEWLSQLATELRVLLAGHAAAGGAPPLRLRLCGGGGALAGLAPRLEAALGIPVAPLRIEPLLEAGVPNPLQFAAAYGLAAAGGLVQTPDLLATEIRRAQAARRRRTRAWAVGTVVLVMLGCAGVIGNRAWHSHRSALRHRAAVARDAATARSITASLEARQEKLSLHVQSLRAALGPQHAWIDVLNDVAARAPAGVWLTGIEMERGKPVIIRGTAMAPEKAAGFVSALAESRLLQQVRLIFANDAQLGRRHVTQFGITALVVGNAPEAKPTARTTRRATKTTAKTGKEAAE